MSHEVMSKEAGAPVRSDAEWQQLDQESILNALELFRRTAELQRLDHPEHERFDTLHDGVEELTRIVLFCRFCLLAIAGLLAVIVLKD